MTVYHKAETAAEKKIWELAHKHGDVDITVSKPLLPLEAIEVLLYLVVAQRCSAP